MSKNISFISQRFHLALRNVVEPCQQFSEGGLPAAARPHNGRGGAGRYREGDVGQNLAKIFNISNNAKNIFLSQCSPYRFVREISERDGVKLDLGRAGPLDQGEGVLIVGDLDLLVHEVEHVLHVDEGLLDDAVEGPQPVEGAHQLGEVGPQQDEVSNTQLVICNLQQKNDNSLLSKSRLKYDRLPCKHSREISPAVLRS